MIGGYGAIREKAWMAQYVFYPERPERQGSRCGNCPDTDTHQDLIKTRVIAPTRLVGTRHQNAADLASSLLTTAALVPDPPSDEGCPPGKATETNGKPKWRGSHR